MLKYTFFVLKVSKLIDMHLQLTPFTDLQTFLCRRPKEKLTLENILLGVLSDTEMVCIIPKSIYLSSLLYPVLLIVVANSLIKFNGVIIAYWQCIVY